MNEKPIIFSGEMVRAILDGRKTVTRRVINPQPEYQPHLCHWVTKGWAYGAVPNEYGVSGCTCKPVKGVTYLEGDLLWVREAWSAFEISGYAGNMEYKEFPNIIYKADSTTRLILNKDIWKYVTDNLKWRPSIHMPRWASRLALRVVNVRAERLQEIDEMDAINEGAWDGSSYTIDPLYPHWHCFKKLWDAINAKRGHSWDSNPWVWRIEFEVAQ